MPSFTHSRRGRYAVAALVAIVLCASAARGQSNNLVDPWSIFIDQDGSLIVSDPGDTGGSGALYRIDPGTGAQVLLAGGANYVDPYSAARIGNNLFIADGGTFEDGGHILSRDLTTGVETKLPTPAVNKLILPFGIASNPAGRLFVANTGLDADTTGLFEINPATGAQTDILTGLTVGFVLPTSLAFETATSSVLIIDPEFGDDGNGAILRVNPNTGANSVVSSGETAGSIFTDPTAIAIGPTGDLFVLDTGFVDGDNLGAILRVNPTTGAQTLVSAGDLLVSPIGLAVAANGDIFVADLGEDEGFILRINPLTGAQSILSPAAVPEPAALTLLALGGCLALATRRRRFATPAYH